MIGFTGLSRPAGKLLLCGGAAMAALALAGPAAAQDAGEAPVEGAESGSGVADIVVTAQRRSENLQRSSLSLDVVGGDDLERAGITDARELNRVVPSMQVAQSGPFTQVFVRGVGSPSANQFGDPSVTFNQDGVVIDRANMIGPLFYDIARVEVLRGPQGTLYGRNATGGAVNVITQRPTSDAGGFVSGQYADYNAYVLTGAVNIPASDTLAFRASGQIQGRDSYLSGGFPTGGYRDTKSQAGRLQALWEPDDRFSLRVIGEVSHNTGPGDSFVLLNPDEPNSSSWLGAANPVANAVITAAAPLQILIRSDDNRVERDLWNLTAELNYDLGFATLTVLPAYRNMTIQSTSYEGGIKLRYDEKSKQTSLETRLANDDGRLKWLVGAFYFDNDRDVYNMIDSNPVSQRALQVFPNIGSKSYAFFGDTTFSLSDSFRLLGGIRYTHEVKTVQGVRTDLDANPTNNFVLDNRRVFKEVTWRAGAELDVGPSSMAYATVATGFKSGGFYTAVSPGNEFEPEHITAYTVGVRNRFLDNRLQLNIEGFYWKYKDNQQSAIGFDGFGNIAFVTRNAGDARLFGVSADIAARLSDNDNLSLNLEYNNSKFNRFTYEVPSFFNPANTGCSVGASTTPGRSRVDCSGFPLPRAPRFTAQAGYSHDFVFDSGAKLSLSLSGQYITSKYLTVDYQQVGKVGDTFTGDIDLTFTPASERFSISGFVNNVTNEEVYTGGAQHQQIARVFYGNINPPRTYGVRARVNF